jgi:CYTH domain-containing protein
MKFQVTHPKIWEAVCEKSMPMKHKIKVYEKMGGAYRLGEDGGEQVFNTMTDLLKHKMGTSVNEGPETNDHEVSMAGGQLDDIIRNATELKSKVGEKEMDLPGWIQDHISQAQNFINQANTGFHELDQK